MNDTTSVWVSLADTLVWPLVVVVLAGLFFWLFRKHVARVIERITRLRLWGNFLDISINIDNPPEETQIEKVIGLQPEAKELDPEKTRHFTLQTGPTPDFVWDGYEHFAVIESWRNLELELVRSLLVSGTTLDTNLRARAIPEQALEAGFISDQEFHTITRMQQVRNLTAHEVTRNIDPVDARQYIVVAEQFIELLRKRRSEEGSQ